MTESTAPGPADPAPDGRPAELEPAELEPATVIPAALPLPVNVRSASLLVIAALASVYALHWAGPVVIPVLLGLMLSYALAPLVNRLDRLRIPRPASAAIVMCALVGGLGWTGYSLRDEAIQFVESLPDAAQKIRQTSRAKRNQPETTIEKVQKAATELEKAAKESSAGAPEAARGVTRVQIERARFNVNDYLLTSTPNLLAAAGQATVVLFIAFFLLASGSSFRRKLVKLAGPTFAKKKITVQALDEITEQIERYLLVQVLISILVGLATGIAYAIIGVEHAAVWGVLACVLNFVPYIGSIVVSVGSALVGYVQFGSVDMALLVGGVAMLLHTVSGNLLTPWLTSRSSQISPVVVFVGVLAFGWLWGLWGLLLGMPVLLMLKAVCDRVEDLKSLGELMGR